MRIILFDIDGTLLLSGGAGLEALRRIFRKHYDVAEAVDGIEFHGLTDPLILRNIARKSLARDLEPAEIDQLRDWYVESLGEVLQTSSPRFRVLAGAREMVTELHGRDDVLMGLATGNFEAAAWAKLGRAGLESYFNFGGFGSDAEDRQELTQRAVDRARERVGNDPPVIVVGDTIHDVRCAHGVGADCLAVATGNASPAVLEEAGARWVVSSLDAPEAREALGLV
ncbi:MAG: HAD hydrolase-like protein [Gemmatimonadetes bacterium]|nr:HAD hydrolase-like protein [Gemmatimonadota bacterium]